ncbi:MAG: transposase [Acidobacteria bacterium]|nr:transposase [Acidobacteriota bacterium]
MYADLVKAPKRRVRRRYSEEFRRQVVEACLQPGISIAAVALANGLNANLLRRWVKDDRGVKEAGNGAGIDDAQASDLRPPTLVPVTVSAPEVERSGKIKIAIHRNQALVEVTWPVSQAAACAQWLREILR